MSDYEIKEFSPLARQLSEEDNAPKTMPNKKYPFDELEIGKCFTIPLADANIKSLKVICARKSKDGKKFVALEHKAHEVVEIARLS
ncbi:hypothetical protein [Xanthomonas phage XAJ2]|uniref:Uncharacterized protein n=1 Tax=Xanthomonas phage XAJ2 TaxID=1775249 RepID=A0A1I9L2L1_9CAUD|nr:hypothetical protein [Xanthomonas phage XAJ2]